MPPSRIRRAIGLGRVALRAVVASCFPLLPTLHVPLNRFRLDCRGLVVEVPPGRPRVMGILNVTPDSFSDGGRHATVDDALRRTEEMVDEGATFIDVGGESSRPRGTAYGEGAEAVVASEELRRVIPVVTAIAQRFPEVVVSVDTYKPEVAREALDAGAHMVNDITGLRFGDELAREAAAVGAPVVLMHSRGRPGDLPHEAGTDGDIVHEVIDSLLRSVAVARQAAVADLVVDPGFGFGKTPAQNLELLARCGELLAIGCPVLIGVSRKATIGRTLSRGDAEAPIDQRLFGSLGATAVAVMQGASIVRTHDVRPTVEMLRVMEETMPFSQASIIQPSVA